MQSAPLARQPQKDPSRVTSVNIFLEHSLLPAVSSLLAGSILAVDFVPMGVMESSLLFHSRWYSRSMRDKWIPQRSLSLSPVQID